MCLRWWLLIWLSIIWMGECERTSDFQRTNYKNGGNRIIFWELHYQINVFKRREIQSHLKESRWLPLPAGLECTFLNVSVYPKHECAVVELISCRKIEKGELVHKSRQGPRKHNPVGNDNECFKIALLITRPLWAGYTRLSYCDAIGTFIHLAPLVLTFCSLSYLLIVI